MSEASSQAALKFSEELLCRPPKERNEDDILRVLPWIRHKSPLFKNLEDGKYIHSCSDDRIALSLVIAVISDRFSLSG